MTANDFEYYLISNTDEPNVPLVKNNDDYDVDGINFVYLNEYANINKSVYLALNPPIPPKPYFEVDYLQLPSAVFSQKIAGVLLPMNIKGHLLIPAIIVDKKRKEHLNFWIENVYPSINCFDDKKSVYKLSHITKSWTCIDKAVLNKDALSSLYSSLFIFFYIALVYFAKHLFVLVFLCP